MSAKKAKAERRSAARIEAIRPAPVAHKRWPLVTIRVLAVLGLVIGAYLSFLHYQAGTDGMIQTPFCGEGKVINCQSVLHSAYADLFGLPVALWAAGTYAALLVVSLLGLTRLLLLLCSWVFVFSLYMAGLSFFKLQSVCLFCLSLYLINTGVFLSAIALVRTGAVVTKQQVVYGFVGCAVLIAVISWQQMKAAATFSSPLAFVAPTPAEIDQGFVRYYNERPVVTLQGAARHTKGPLNAALTISEFADFRCPSCAQAHTELARLRGANPNDIRVIFYHYPLDQTCNPNLRGQVHPGACAAAIAAECASDQGKFWEYADLLFADQKRYARKDLESYAETLGLDLDRFQACLDDSQTRRRVVDDIEEAARIEVKATPTLVINGRLIEGLPPAKKIATLITLEKQQAASE